MQAPRYSYHPGVFAAFLRDIILLHRRDFHRDAQACIARLTPPLQVLHPENIPQRGPCIITVNHYHRRGFGAQWIALAIASLVPAPMHWIMTGEFTYPDKWYGLPGSVGSKLLLERIAAIYNFTTMPPMPPREKDLKARATAVRAVLEHAGHNQNMVLGLAPEGHDASNTGVLTRPFSGVGRFGLLLSGAGLAFVPAGVYEAGGIFHVCFGKAYQLSIPRRLPPEEKDRQASKMIMENIARLLPVQLRGEFA